MGIMVYGTFEARQIHTETVVLSSSKIPPSSNPMRIVQISDMHLGLMLYPGRLANMTAAIKAARPDLLVSTGDLMDSRIPGADTAAQALNAIAAPLGKFAVTGNHEFYAGIEQAVLFTRQAGFTLLRGNAVKVNDYLTIAGVDDPTGGRTQLTNEKDLLNGLPAHRFTILLKHRPEIDPTVQKHIDLQLSGHTHKGQIFPFTYVIQSRYRFIEGLHRIAAGPYLYVSRGTGTWGPPVRFLARPEITVFELRSERSN
jgi:predicted MPP superfamily phosphohydrolase